MGVRVACAGDGGRVHLRSAIVRVGGMVLAAIPFCAGFLLILIDDRRRGLQDRLARTIVVYAGDRPPFS